MDARPRDTDEPPEEPTDEVGEASPVGDPGADADGAEDRTDAAAGREAVPAEPVDDDRTGPVAGTPHDEIADVDRRWQEIVAQLADLDGPRGRVDARSDDTPGAPVPDVAAQTPSPPPPGRVVRAAADPRGWEPDPVLEEAENHFEPPDPGPVLTGDPLLVMAWSAVVGVPVLMLLAVVLWRDMPALVLQVAGIAFALGLGLLVWRMPQGDDEDRGPGAVV